MRKESPWSSRGRRRRSSREDLNGSLSITATDAPYLVLRQPVLLREFSLSLAGAVLLADIVVPARVLAELRVSVADDVGDGL
jgi:hypothetical protein